ncbi:hypothetical protein C8Q80DRAFT_715685 [Daedaleopsis nitida]|nr:hypothetical protein C8Q80DRAFT_715685 [Daedaleopsis nitida]
MSTFSAVPELDFWEFVNCGICHLEFVKDSGGLSSVPFWLTECGHVVCNSHINADQSCAECGSQGIQYTPLAKELEPPMSNWFLSAPVAFDAVGYALRFQMNTMAALLRHFKRKYLQYRPLYDRLKDEHIETKRLKKLVEDLQAENQQLRAQLHNGFVGDTLNENSKRRRLDEEANFSRHRTSSPHSATSAPTPVGPERLTLPPGHHQPHFNLRHTQRSSDHGAPQQQLA